MLPLSQEGWIYHILSDPPAVTACAATAGRFSLSPSLSLRKSAGALLARLIAVAHHLQHLIQQFRLSEGAGVAEDDFASRRDENRVGLRPFPGGVQSSDEGLHAGLLEKVVVGGPALFFQRVRQAGRKHRPLL